MSEGRRKRRANEAAFESKRRFASRPLLESKQSLPPACGQQSGKSAFSLQAGLLSLALVAINLAVYAPVRYFDFVSWDDPIYVGENPEVLSGLSWPGLLWAFTTGHAPYWHPLTWLSHMLDIQIYGLNAGGHHFTSVFIHIANTLLLFGLIHRMTGALGRSAFVAGLFAVHPLHVESVAWVAERKDVLSTLFWVLTLWAYVFYVERPGLQRYLLVLLFFALGLMAKPMLVTLPFVLLLLDFWPLRRIAPVSDSSGTWAWAHVRHQWLAGLPLAKEKLPLLGVAIASSIVTFLVAQQVGAVTGLGAFPLRLRLENAAVTYVAYIGQTLWPARLAAFYPYLWAIPGWQVLGAILLLTGVTIVVIRATPRFPYVLVGWAWYLGTLFPVIGLFQAGEQARADRFTYVPSIGLFLIVAWAVPDLLARWPKVRVALPAAAVLATVTYALVASTQVQYWRNSTALWGRVLDVTSGNYIAHSNLGNVLLDNGKIDEAIAQYSEALRIKPDFALAQDNLGIVLVNQGKPGEAVAHLSEALRIKPDFAEAHNDLGVALTRIGRPDEAIAHYSEALRLQPAYALAHANLGNVLVAQGKVDEAIQEYLEALKVKPDDANFHYNLGAILNTKGERQRAISEFNLALRLKPGYPEAERALEILKGRGN